MNIQHEEGRIIMIRSNEQDWKYESQVKEFPEQIYCFRPVEPISPGDNENNVDKELIDFRPYVLVDTIHDGFVIPDKLYDALGGNDSFRREQVLPAYIGERDWGARAVAESVAKHLRIDGFHEILIARTVLDFGRFPGISRPWSAHLDRLAVSGPLVPYIRKHCQDDAVRYYKDIADQMEAAIEEKLRASAIENNIVDPAKKIRNSRFIRIAIHTFDEYDRDHLRRPMVGLIHRSRSIATQGHLPDGVFSRHFPDQLATFSADRLLKSCLSCAFEKNYIPEHSDWPYMLPEGAVEMRIQAWFWLRYLRAAFETEATGQKNELIKLIGEETYNDYWTAIQNLNSIRPTSGVIAKYIEGQVKADDRFQATLEKIRIADQAITRFLDEARPDEAGIPLLVRRYQYDAYRPSCIVIEVRKNSIFGQDWEKRVDDNGFPDISNIDQEWVDKVGRSVKEGLEMYWQWQKEKKEDEHAEL